MEHDSTSDCNPPGLPLQLPFSPNVNIHNHEKKPLQTISGRRSSPRKEMTKAYVPFFLVLGLGTVSITCPLFQVYLKYEIELYSF